MSSLHRAALGAVLLLAGVAAACAPERPVAKSPFTAIWIGTESAPLAGAELARLERAGLQELFYEAAALDFSSGAPRLVERFAPPLPRGLPTTLVVTGAWLAVEERPAATARAWREAIESLEAAAEHRGARPVGVHFAVADPGAGRLARVLAGLREELGARLHLSVELDAARLDEEETAALARAADYVVVFVYGQRPAEPDAGELWDLDRARERIVELDRLGVPYALGAWTLGGAQRRGAGGEVLDRAPGVDIGALVRAPGLEPKPGAVFEGLGRQVIERVARAPVRVGGLDLARGEWVRIARPTTADVERFLAVAAPAPGSARLGVVLRRLPGRDESLSLSSGNLAAALAPGEAQPALRVRLVRAGAPDGRARLRVVLENGNEEATDFGVHESNYLELRLARGSWGAVRTDGFDAAERLHEGRSRTVRALREPDTVRLYAAHVSGGQRIASGPIEVRGAGDPETIAVSGTFILPGGRELVLPPRQVRIEAEAP